MPIWNTEKGVTVPLIPDRDLRQRDIVPPERLAACRATIVGVGAIGRQVALQLAYPSDEPRLQIRHGRRQNVSVLNGGMNGEDGCNTRSEEGSGMAQTY
jgi:hypothetical protein